MKKEQILGKYLVPNDKLVSWREIDDEILFLDQKEKAFYELNKTASFIWKEAARKRNIREIIEAMQGRYAKINKEILKKDMLDFMSNLLKKRYFLLKNEL